jgi:hypothetical protein
VQNYTYFLVSFLKLNFVKISFPLLKILVKKEQVMQKKIIQAINVAQLNSAIAKEITLVNPAGDWGKNALHARIIQGNTLQLNGRLLDDCEFFTIQLKEPLPAGTEFRLAVKLGGSIFSTWGGAMMFAVGLNGTQEWLRPKNRPVQTDGMIQKGDGHLHFSVPKRQTLYTLGIKTFAGVFQDFSITLLPALKPPQQLG